MLRRTSSIFILPFFSFLAAAMAADGQASQRAATLVTRSIDEADRVVLHGNTHPAVRNATDLGKVPDSMTLVPLGPTPEPASLVLVTPVLGALYLRRRRRTV